MQTVRLGPKSLSGLVRNHCPAWSEITVRLGPKSLSGLVRNHCPAWSEITVRLGPKYAEFLNLLFKLFGFIGFFISCGSVYQLDAFL
jgi:hypothetical protein